MHTDIAFNADRILSAWRHSCQGTGPGAGWQNGLACGSGYAVSQCFVRRSRNNFKHVLVSRWRNTAEPYCQSCKTTIPEITANLRPETLTMMKGLCLDYIKSDEKEGVCRVPHQVERQNCVRKCLISHLRFLSFLRKANRARGLWLEISTAQSINTFNLLTSPIPTLTTCLSRL